MYNDTPSNNLKQLGIEAKAWRQGAEQFCVFAFDLEVHKRLYPPVTVRTRENSMKIGGKKVLPWAAPANWLAAFWKMCQPMHTEQAILEKFDKWHDRYESSYGTPSSLYIYSFLIPCLRDGSNGHCSEAIANMINQYREIGKPLKVYIGWGNDDTDADMAHSTKNALGDKEGQHLQIFPRISIAK